jgi:hypothetical protein
LLHEQSAADDSLDGRPLSWAAAKDSSPKWLCGIGRSKCVGRVCGGWNGIHFVGRIGAQAPPRMLDEAQRLVNSLPSSTISRCRFEAFAAGFPVVSTPTGGIAERVREGKPGSWWSRTPPSAPIIERLLRDPQRALLIARRARRDLDQYTWSQVREVGGSVSWNVNMCGIAGILKLDPRLASRKTVSAGCAKRSGTVDLTTTGSGFLARSGSTQRLSIVDVTAGHQPMRTEDGRV